MSDEKKFDFQDVSEEELLAATRRENILNDWNGEDNKQLKHRLMQEQKEKWMTKPLHGQFLRQTQQIADSKSWANNRWAKERN